MQFHMAYKTSEQSIYVYALCKKAINISNSKKKGKKEKQEKNEFTSIHENANL